MVVRIHPRIRLPVIICGALLIALWLGLSQEQTYEIWMQVSGTWGEAPGSFGRIVGEDGAVYGPRSFFVDGLGKLYVLDSYNKRVQVFGSAGALERVLELPEAALPLDIVADSTGTVYYVSSDARVRSASVKEGFTEPDVVYSLKAESGDVASIEWIRYFEPGFLVIKEALVNRKEARARIVRLRLPLYPGSKEELVWGRALQKLGEPTVLPESIIQEPVHDLVQVRNGWLTLSFKGSRLRLSAYNWLGRLKSETDITPNFRVRSAYFAGVDGQGNVYVAINAGYPLGGLYKYSSQGKSLGSWSLPESKRSSRSAQVRVTRQGDFYYSMLGEDGYQVVRWKAHTTWKLRWGFHNV